MSPFLHGDSQTLWHYHVPPSLICCSVMNEVQLIFCSPLLTSLFWRLTPLRLLLPLTFNTIVYNNSYSWQVNWGFPAGPLLWVRLKPFYQTTYPVMDVHSSKTVLSEASGLEPVTHHTLPCWTLLLYPHVALGFRLIQLHAAGSICWLARLPAFWPWLQLPATLIAVHHCI